MKFYRGGELYKHLKAKRRFGEEPTKFYVAQIVLALGELHKQKVVYRDMKPENTLLDVDGYVALADFGLSKILTEEGNTKSFCGTPDYIAPEIIRNEEYNKQVDWWDIDILIYELISGRHRLVIGMS
jgi:serum/glucocorticoid-regulated kinase 2